MQRLITAFCILLSSFAVISDETTQTDIARTDNNILVKTVMISKVVDHKALNATVAGIIAGLEQSGYKDGEKLRLVVESAQGSPAVAAQIANKFYIARPSVVVGVGTLAAQSLAKYAQQDNMKLIFSSVTDPVGAGLIKSIARPQNNTSGVSNFIPLEPQLALMQQLQPKLRTLGVIYNPGETNSLYILDILDQLASKFNIIIKRQTVTKTADVPQAASKLAPQVDAFFISNDNTALSALQSIIQIANKVMVPVYVSDTDAVQSGALAAVGPNQYDIGVQTGLMIARLLKGEPIEDIPVEYPDKTQTYINLTAAKLLTINIPSDVLLEADVMIGDQA